MRNELQAFDTGIPTGATLRDPAVIMDEAKERCQVLTAMVEQTKSFTQIGPSKHLRVEAWVTLAQFYGCSGRIVQTEDISIAGVVGFKAHAQVYHDQTGTLLSSADAICMQDESNWEKKPLHQIMSMAQTRALSKALAAKFRWVVVLGGFSATPAEEVSGEEKKEGKKKKAAPSNELRTPNYGPEPNVPLSEATTEHLKVYLDGAERSITDPKRANFLKQNTAMRDALKAEIAKREKSGPASEQKPESKPADHAQAKPDVDAAYLSQVIDCEDWLRGSQQGKGSLRSIRAGFKLEDGAYPLLPQDQADYLSDLKRSVERMQADK